MLQTDTNGTSQNAGIDRALEARLLRDYHERGDQEARRRLIERLMPLARSLAMRYRRGSEPLEDLVQVAAMGLVKAVDGFDTSRERPFVSYAVPTILGELRRHFRDRVWSVHLPRSLQESTMKVRDAIEELSERHGRAPTVPEVAEHTELPEEAVLEALQASDARRTVSLDAPVASSEDETAPMIDTVGAPDGGFASVRTQLAAETASLNARELKVLRLRFEEDMTQTEIAPLLGVSQMQISRIMRRALQKLLDAVEDDGIDEGARISLRTEGGRGDELVAA